MAIKNNRIFGLSVPLSLADVISRSESLRSLGINREDLEIIRGISENGFDKLDLQTISNLSVPAWKSFDRYINDVTTYSDTLTSSGGSDFQLRGNLHVAGGIGSTAFRYKILDTEPDPQDPNATPILKWGDISTSRVSSWSTIGTNISYGGDVEIGGTLKVGKIKTRTVATTKVFDSEVPTHRIKIDLNGQTRYIYAMKGIPLQFEGYFRNFLAKIDFNPVLGKKVSWRIRRTDGLTSPEDFESYGGTNTSTLDYRSPFSAERIVEVYYSPDAITNIQLSNTNVRNLPRVGLNNLKTFIFANNGLVDFPDVNFFAPNLETLNISNNPFFNASDADERRLNQLIADKLPATLRSLDIRGGFFGGIEQGIFGRFTELRTLQIDKSGSTYFYPDSTNPNGELPFFFGDPNDPSTHKLRSIYARNNDFRSIGTPTAGSNLVSVKQIESLVNLYIDNNPNLLDDNFQIASDDIVNITIDRTKLACPNLQARTSLRSFSATYNTNFKSLFNNWDGTGFTGGNVPVGVSDASYKFAGCSSLESINLSYSNVAGYIPKFIGNSSLTYINLTGCSGLIAGRPGKSDIKCFYNDTFEQARSVTTIYVSINNTNFAGEIDRNTFVPLNDSLSILHLYGRGRFTGAFPDLESCTKLTDLRSNNQNWGKNTETTLPNLSSSFSITRIELRNNYFIGSLQYTNKNSLDYLDVTNNDLTSISTAFSAPNLKYFYASSNNFTGSLPNLETSCPLVEYVSLNNNQFTSYTRGNGFVNLPRLKQLDFSANILSQTAVDNVLFDLVDNYKAANRSGVIVNLTGSNASPSPYPVIEGIITGFNPILQPAINSGVVVDLGGVGGLTNPSEYSPVSGNYSNLTLFYQTPGGAGKTAKASFRVNVDYDENLVETIGSFTAPNNNPALYDTGIINTIGTFSAPQNASSLYSTGIVDGLGSFTAPGNTPPQGVVDAIGSPTAPRNVQPTGIVDVLGTFFAARNNDQIPPYVAGTYTDSNPPAGGTAAEVSLTVNAQGQVTNVTLVSGGSGYTDADQIVVATDVIIEIDSVFDQASPYVSGNFTDSNPPDGGVAAVVSISVNAQGQVNSATLVSGGEGYSNGDNIIVQTDVSIPVVDAIDIDPSYIGGTYVDQNAGAGKTAAQITVGTSGGAITSVSISSGGSGYTTSDIIRVLDDVTIPISSTYDENPGYFNIYTAGTFADTNPPAGGTAATVTVNLNGSGYITSVVLASGGTGYITTDTITVSPDITVPISTVYDENPAQQGIYPANKTNEVYLDTSAPPGGTAASVNVTTDAGGYIQSVTLNNPGTGYSINDTINFLGDVSVPVNTIIDRFYNSASYTITKINKGGYDYAPGDILRTSDSIFFEKADGTLSKGHLIFEVSSITSRVDTTVFKGVAAVAYLRNVGWTVQVNN